MLKLFLFLNTVNSIARRMKNGEDADRVIIYGGKVELIMIKRLISICIIGIMLCGIYKYVQSEEISPMAESIGDIEGVKAEDDESADPIYIIEPQLTQDDTYEMQDWQAAYTEYIESVEYAPYNKYALIYVDEDNIPELVINTNTYATACTVLTCHDGQVDALQTWSLQCNYIEKKNLYWDAGGQMGEFYDQVYTIENGKWVKVEGGEYIAKLDEDGLIIEEYDYAWEGKAVPKDIYYDKLAEVYDWEQNQNVGAEQYERLDEMLFRLQTGTALSQTHRYELYIEDVTWDEAKEDCYLYDAPMDMLLRNPEYTGKVGYICEYDPITVMSKETYYNADGSIDYWKENEYDIAGNPTKVNFYNPSDGIFRWDEYEYDSAGNRTKVIGYWGDGSFYYRVEDEYDSVGSLTKETTYDADGSIYFWHEYEYDNAGNRTKSTGYEDDGSNTGWIEWEYDGSGNMTKEINYNNDGSIHYWYEYEYDSRGNKTKETVYHPGDEAHRQTEWEYDNMGNLTKYMEYRQGEIDIWREYEYITITPHNEATVSN